MPSTLTEALPGHVPDLIAAAGERAVAAYHAFLNDPVRSPNTRQVYRQRVHAFFRWAERRGLTLQTISWSTLRAYRAEIAAARASHEASVYLTPVRGVFFSLVSSGVLPEGFFVEQADRSEAPKPLADGEFPLLSLMAMLAHMEEQSLQRVLTEDVIARKLLEFVRRRDGRQCTHCGAPCEDADAQCDGGDGRFRCQTCSGTYAVTDASPFEGLPMPLHDGLLVLFRLFLHDESQPDRTATPPMPSIDQAAVSQLAVRIAKAFARDGLAPAGDGLRQAIDRRNRELEQDEVVRDIIRYAEQEAALAALLKAQAEGAAVDDLPPGMTLEEAIDTLGERIAEHDRYMIHLKDGYLAYHWPETGESAKPERPAAPPADAQQAAHEH